MDLQGPDFSDSRDPIFSDFRDRMIILSDSRAGLFLRKILGTGYGSVGTRFSLTVGIR